MALGGSECLMLEIQDEVGVVYFTPVHIISVPRIRQTCQLTDFPHFRYLIP